MYRCVSISRILTRLYFQKSDNFPDRYIFGGFAHVDSDPTFGIGDILHRESEVT